MSAVEKIRIFPETDSFLEFKVISKLEKGFQLVDSDDKKWLLVREDAPTLGEIIAKVGWIKGLY